MYARVLASLVVLIVIALLGGPYTSAQIADPVTPTPPPVAMTAGTVEVDPGVSSAVLEAVRRAQDILPTMCYCAITSAYGTGSWRYISVAGLRDLQPDGSWSLLDNGSWFGLVVLRQAADGSWHAAVEGTPDYGTLVADTPDQVLSPRARQDLSPSGATVHPAAVSLRFPWQPGTAMLYGSRGVHNSDFTTYFGIPTWKAVDFVSDGNTSLGHAPNRILASAPGTIGAVCNDGHSLAIRMDSGGAPQLLYAHLLNNSSLHTGASFAQGDFLGQLKTGPFSYSCGWAQQDPGWFHIHYGFPGASGYFPIEGWTLDLTSQFWYAGNQSAGIGRWLLAGSMPPPPAAPAAPVLSSPADHDLEPATYPLKFIWNQVSGADDYQIEWSGGPYTSTLPFGWFSGTSYDIGPVAPGDYVWHVRARNSIGLSPWSDTRHITISPLQMAQPLTITPTMALLGGVVTAQYRVTNVSGQPLTLKALGLQVIGPTCHDPSCAQYDRFPPEPELTLAPGEAHTYTGRQAFDATGWGYLAAPAYQDAGGAWHQTIAGTNQVSFNVVERTYLPLLLN